jgi:hypothetical protein
MPCDTCKIRPAYVCMPYLTGDLPRARQLHHRNSRQREQAAGLPRVRPCYGGAGEPCISTLPLTLKAAHAHQCHVSSNANAGQDSGLTRLLLWCVDCMQSLDGPESSCAKGYWDEHSQRYLLWLWVAPAGDGKYVVPTWRWDSMVRYAAFYHCTSVRMYSRPSLPATQCEGVGYVSYRVGRVMSCEMSVVAFRDTWTSIQTSCSSHSIP